MSVDVSNQENTQGGGKFVKLQEKMQRPEFQSKMAIYLGGEHKLQEASTYISDVLRTIQSTVGDKEKDLSSCTPASIMNACLDAARLRLPIDKRQLAHLVKYGTNCTFQIGYRAYLDRISKRYPDASFTTGVIYEDDEFSLVDRTGYHEYSHVPAKMNLFKQVKIDDTAMLGYFCHIAFTDPAGGKQSNVTVIGREDLLKIKEAAKSKAIWNAWCSEKCKVAVIRRAAKYLFTTLCADLDEQDNKDYDLDKSPTDVATPLFDVAAGEGLSSVIDAKVLNTEVDAEGNYVVGVSEQTPGVVTTQGGSDSQAAQTSAHNSEGN